MADHEAVDVHQHLWPGELVDRLRARSRAPYLRGWTLFTRGEAAYDVAPEDHDPTRRVAQDEAAGVGLACVALSAPLGIECLPRPEAAVLLEAWHAGAAALPDHFAAWASVPMVDPDLGQLAGHLAGGFVGLQLPATDLLSPGAWDRAGDVLRVVELAGKPLLIHPGPAISQQLSGRLPEWWAPVVTYVTQMQAAWWGWHAARVREQFPTLRVVFAAGAGLAPLHHERHASRGGQGGAVDPDVFVDTSSYGAQAVDALTRALGIDALVLGSDAPYATALDTLGAEPATRAIRVTNPVRALGTRPSGSEEAGSWRRAS